ncbi:MAG: T9SS type A sorting domain-containing protein, partial [Bacteroidota bacterium]|nr:T9SS type A sorting domain-containing protein [Bacteroidota bacterium]
TAETLWVTSGGTFYVTVTNASGCSVSDSIFVVNLGTIYSIRNSKLQVFPNPASDMLNIKLNNGSIWEIHIYNATGQLFYSEKTSQNTCVIDTKKFAQGFYILHCKTANNSILSSAFGIVR